MHNAAQIPMEAPVATSAAMDLLKTAIAKALELEQLLGQVQTLDHRERYHLRLARAHALSVVDEVTDLVCHAPGESQAADPGSIPESGVYRVLAKTAPPGQRYERSTSSGSSSTSLAAS
jgi:hypothetical protein